VLHPQAQFTCWFCWVQEDPAEPQPYCHLPDGSPLMCWLLRGPSGVQGALTEQVLPSTAAPGDQTSADNTSPRKTQLKAISRGAAGTREYRTSGKWSWSQAMHSSSRASEAPLGTCCTPGPAAQPRVLGPGYWVLGPGSLQQGQRLHTHVYFQLIIGIPFSPPLSAPDRWSTPPHTLVPEKPPLVQVLVQVLVLVLVLVLQPGCGQSMQQKSRSAAVRPGAGMQGLWSAGSLVCRVSGLQGLRSAGSPVCSVSGLQGLWSAGSLVWRSSELRVRDVTDPPAGRPCGGGGGVRMRQRISRISAEVLRTWRTHGEHMENMENTRITHGEHMENMENTRITHGEHMENTWRTWRTHGEHMENIEIHVLHLNSMFSMFSNVLLTHV